MNGRLILERIRSWKWPLAGGVGAAVLVTGAAIAWPLVMSGTDALEGAGLPFELEAEFTVVDNSRSVGTSIQTPQSSPPVNQVTHRGVVRWYVVDQAHYRWELELTSPPLESNTIVAAADGETVVMYDQASHTFSRTPYKALPGASIAPPLVSFLLGPMPYEDVQSFLSGWGGGSGRSTTVVGEEDILGRRTVIVELTAVSGRSEDTSGNSSTRAEAKRVWLDPERMFVMRMASESAVVSGLVEVTLLRYDVPSSEISVVFKPPADAEEVDPDGPMGTTSSGGSISMGAGAPFTHTGFLNPEYVPTGWAATSVEEETSSSGKSAVETLYQRSPAAADYLRISQRKRADGLPAQLGTGVPVNIDGRVGYRGTDGGAKTLAWEQDDIAVVLASNALSYEEIEKIAASMVMR